MSSLLHKEDIASFSKLASSPLYIVILKGQHNGYSLLFELSFGNLLQGCYLGRRPSLFPCQTEFRMITSLFLKWDLCILATPICWKVTQPLCQLHTEGTPSFRRSDYCIFVAFSSWKVTQAIWLDKHYQSIKHSEKFIMCNVKKP